MTWVDGRSARISGEKSCDVAITTSHVVQASSDDDAWAQILNDVYRALAPGGRLVCDSRDRSAKIRERWTPARTRAVHTLPDGTSVETWVECLAQDEGLFTATGHGFSAAGISESATTCRVNRS